MNKGFFQRFVVLAFILLLPAAAWAGPVVENKSETVEGFTFTDPAKLSNEEYARQEHILLVNASGSGGYFLDDDEIAWLKKGQRIHPIKKGETDRPKAALVAGDSLHHREKFREAIAEYQKGGFSLAAEEIKWLLRNPTMQGGGAPKLHFVKGRLPVKQLGSVEIVGNKNIDFVAAFKGGLYLDDKKNKRHAVIFVPEWEYSWLKKLNFDGKELTAEFADGGPFRFNPKTQMVSFKTHD